MWTEEIDFSVLAIVDGASSGKMDMVRHYLYGLERPAILHAGLGRYRLCRNLNCSCEYGVPVLVTPDNVVLQ